jgi:hypothetical protein
LYPRITVRSFKRRVVAEGTAVGVEVKRERVRGIGKEGVWGCVVSVMVIV